RPCPPLTLQCSPNCDAGLVRLPRALVLSTVYILKSIFRLGRGRLGAEPQFVNSLSERDIHAEDMTVAQFPVLIEPPASVAGIVFTCLIGQYCAINGALVGSQVMIGRYSQTAMGSHVGVGGHPTDWLSTHYFQYRDHFSPYPKDDPHRLYHSVAETKPTLIGSDVWIGANAVVFSGLKIGHGAFVGA